MEFESLEEAVAANIKVATMKLPATVNISGSSITANELVYTGNRKANRPCLSSWSLPIF